MKIIVWGLGEIGKRWINELKLYQKELNIEIIAVVDSNVKEPLEELSDLRFVDKEDIKKYKFDYVVITSQKYFDEINNELTGILGKNKKGIRYDEFSKKIALNGKYYCNLCNTEISYWKYIGIDQEIFSKKKIIGGGKRKGMCPICRSIDRARYMYKILKDYTDIFDEKKVLHFAPEESLREKFSGKYITADLRPGWTDVVADITALQFEDNSFDYILCNHVLEHITNEALALSELGRCLKKEGILILTMPICWEEKTYENPAITKDEERAFFYGQVDHVRLYGNDIIERFQRAGFYVNIFKSDELFSDEDIERFGFIKGDTVFLLKKQNRDNK